MTIDQQRKILKKIQKLQKQINELEEIIVALSKSEFVSATMSSGGGSRSYTRMDLGKITETVKELKSQLKNNRKLLSGESQSLGKLIYQVFV